MNLSLLLKQGVVCQRYLYLCIPQRESISSGLHLGGIVLLVILQIGLRCLHLAKLSLAVKCRYSGHLEQWSVRGARRTAEPFQGEADVTCIGWAGSPRCLLRKIMPFVRV